MDGQRSRPPRCRRSHRGRSAGQAPRRRLVSRRAAVGLSRDDLRSAPVLHCRPPESRATRSGHAAREDTPHLPECCRADQKGQRRDRSERRKLAHVSGMICIRPIAPLGDTARTSPPLSTCITARIHDAGMPDRSAASVTDAAKGSEANCDGLVAMGSARTACPISKATAKPMLMTTRNLGVRELGVRQSATSAMAGKEEG